MTVLPLARTTGSAPRLDAHNTAVAWLFRHAQALSRLDAVSGCIAHLMTDHSMSERSAEATAMQAYGEINTANHRARINADLTTAYVVALDTGDGHQVMLTVGDLMAVVSQARQAGNVKRVERHTTH